MKNWKLLYIFTCPLGKYTGVVAVKIGITGHPEVRLGVYQNSYSSDSHKACFDVVYIGPTRAIEKLELAIKQEFNWDIQRDGRGESEWVKGYSPTTMETSVDALIKGYCFKINKVPKKFLPLNIDNMKELLEHYNLNSNEHK